MIPLEYRNSVPQMDALLRPKFTIGGWFDSDGHRDALKRYAEGRAAEVARSRLGSAPSGQVEKERGVLERMRERGCKGCEIAAQVRYIESLEKRASNDSDYERVEAPGNN